MADLVKRIVVWHQYDNTALIWAVYHNYPDVLEVLIEFGANVNAKNNVSLPVCLPVRLPHHPKLSVDHASMRITAIPCSDVSHDLVIFPS